MKKFTLIGLTLALLAYPAWALKITNLDTVSHRVMFDSAGSQQVETIAPNETMTISGQPAGTLSLLSANPSQPSRGTLYADGVLSGVVGAVRSEHIPVNDGDTFAIWPGGKLLLQKHRTNDGSGSIF